MNKIVLVFFIVIIFSAMTAAIIRSCSNRVYVDDYFIGIGVWPGTPHCVILDIFGEPKEIITQDDDPNFSIVRYSGIEFIVNRGNNFPETGVLWAVRIFDPAIRFGQRQIGVQSTKEEIKSTYSAYSFRANSNKIDVVDGDTWLTFFLDESNIVTQISLFIGGP
jgi:hypothetical protein